MVTHGTQVNPNERRLDHVTSPAQAATGNGPMWPPTLSHYFSYSFHT